MTIRRGVRRQAAVAVVGLLLCVGMSGCHDNLVAGRRASTSTVEVVRVLDGDTFDATDSAGGRVRVRLLGIDAPEVAHGESAAECGAAAASRQLGRLVTGRRVVLVTDPGGDAVDRYGRLLRYVEVRGVDVGLRQVRSGLAAAWHPATSSPPERYAGYVAAQLRSRAAQRGSWATCSSLGR